MKTLDDLATGKDARVVTLEGERDFVRRLNALGIHEGIRLRKLTDIGLGGPIVALVDRAQVAIGRNMAKQILVEED
jgi:ferrous iron transport protein A